VILNLLAMIATFYTSLWPVGGSPDAEVFFENYLAAPIVLALYLFWKVWSRDWKMFVRAKDMDVTTGIRRGSIEMAQEMRGNSFKKALRAFF
jgi:yeast amino acid transporter